MSKFVILISIALLVSQIQAVAVTTTGCAGIAGGCVWTNTGIWTPAAEPTAVDDVTLGLTAIGATGYTLESSGAAVAKSLIVGSSMARNATVDTGLVMLTIAGGSLQVAETITIEQADVNNVFEPSSALLVNAGTVSAASVNVKGLLQLGGGVMSINQLAVNPIVNANAVVKIQDANSALSVAAPAITFPSQSTFELSAGTFSTVAVVTVFTPRFTASSGSNIAVGGFSVREGAAVTNGAAMMTITHVGGNSTNISGRFTNTGSLRVTGGDGSFSVMTGGAFTHTGALFAVSPGTVSVTGSFTASGGEIALTGVSLDDGSTFNIAGATVTFAGAFAKSSTATASILRSSVIITSTLQSPTTAMTFNDSTVTLAAPNAFNGKFILSNSTLIASGPVSASLGAVTLQNGCRLFAAIGVADINSNSNFTLESLTITGSVSLTIRLRDRLNATHDGRTFTVLSLSNDLTGSFSRVVVDNPDFLGGGSLSIVSDSATLYSVRYTAAPPAPSTAPVAAPSSNSNGNAPTAVAPKSPIAAPKASSGSIAHFSTGLVILMFCIALLN